MGAEVLGRNNGWYVILQGGTLPIRLSFQKVEDPTPGKNRIHLDVMAADLDDEVELLLGNGATLVARRRDESFRWKARWSTRTSTSPAWQHGADTAEL